MRVHYLACELNFAARRHIRNLRVLRKYENSKYMPRDEFIPTDLWFVKQAAYEEMPEAKVVTIQNEKSDWRLHYGMLI